MGSTEVCDSDSSDSDDLSTSINAMSTGISDTSYFDYCN